MKKDRGVFLNCPFNPRYNRILRALVFTVHDCGFVARSAQEFDDASQVRIDKIYKLIADCRFGIHDLTKISLDGRRLPRFNMPLELGIFLGAKRYGGAPHRLKRCLVLVRDEDSYQDFCSDIAGQDVSAYHGDVKKVVKSARDWFAKLSSKRLPGPVELANRYAAFSRDLPRVCRALRWDSPSRLLFTDYATAVAEWQQENAW